MKNDHIDHGTMQELIRKRVSDRGILRLTGRWLRAGVLDEGQFLPTNDGTPRDGVISRLLANSNPLPYPIPGGAIAPQVK